MPKEPELGGTANVTVTFRLEGLGSWSPGTQLDQVYKQASDAARGIIQRMVVEAGKNGTRATIVTEPEVDAVVYRRNTSG